MLAGTPRGAAESDGADLGVDHGFPYAEYGLTGGLLLAVHDAVWLEGTVWIATEQGVFFQRDEQGWVYGWAYVSGLPERNTTAVLPLPDGSTWIGTAAHGLVRFVPR